MLQGKNLEYLKEHEPIGCRDYYTVGLLKEKGIDAYFSGCMTLTLSETCRYNGNKREGIYFVDASVERIHKYDYPTLLLQSLFTFRSVLTLYQKNWRYVGKLRHWCQMEKFYATFSKVFEKDTLLSATYIS